MHLLGLDYTNHEYIDTLFSCKCYSWLPIIPAFHCIFSDITMSFRFSQSLSQSFSQELDNSQDSGYSASGGTQASSSTYFPHNSSARPPFPTRRTLPRPPTWPNINIQQPQLRGGSKWKFGGRQEREGRSALERDLQQHLQEISNQTNKVPGKLSTVVMESVKYMQEVYRKEGQDGREELSKIGSDVHGLKKQIQVQESDNNKITEELTELETVLAECELLCKEVTKGKERNKQKLAYLQEQIQKSSFSQTKIEEEIMRFSRAEANDRRSKVLARACGVPAVGVRAVDCWQ